MKEKYGAKSERSLKLRFHTQTAGFSLSAQQPQNNISRTAFQGLAAVLGGTQSLHTNSMDETLALPSQHAAEIALRTQQLIAFETGVTNVVDPLGGSWYVEELTDKMEKEAYNYFSKIDDLGGVIPAIEMGYFQREIAEAASDYQRRVDSKRRIVVGVNKISKENEEIEIPILDIRNEVEREQIEGLKSLREKRNEETVDAKLKSITDACRTKDNLIPLIIDAGQSHATLGELVTSMKVVFGEWQETAVV
jgi:methylmalonyl-CoA mutase N-terminal domain/subunit